MFNFIFYLIYGFFGLSFAFFSITEIYLYFQAEPDEFNSGNRAIHKISRDLFLISGALFGFLSVIYYIS